VSLIFDSFGRNEKYNYVAQGRSNIACPKNFSNTDTSTTSSYSSTTISTTSSTTEKDTITTATSYDTSVSTSSSTADSSPSLIFFVWALIIVGVLIIMAFIFKYLIYDRVRYKGPFIVHNNDSDVKDVHNNDSEVEDVHDNDPNVEDVHNNDEDLNKSDSEMMI